VPAVGYTTSPNKPERGGAQHRNGLASRHGASGTRWRAVVCLVASGGNGISGAELSISGSLLMYRDGTAVSNVRARGGVAAAGLVYLLGLGILLIAPLRIVGYHTLFWQFTGRHLGLGWTAGREQALDAAVNAALFVPLGFLGHRWRRAGSTPSWAAASATLTLIWLAAAGMEIVQIFLPWRSASVADVFSSAIGAMAGAGLDALFAHIALRSRHRAPPMPP